MSVLAAPARANEGEITFERWYALQLEGERIGYAQAMTRRTDDHLITHSAMTMSVRRGAVTLELEQSSRFVETHEGSPVKAHSRSKMGQTATEQTWRFEGGTIELTTRQADRERTRELAAEDDDWLPPAAAQRYVERQMDAGAERIELRTLEPTLGHEPLTMSMQVIDEREIEVLGKRVPAIVWEATLSVMPGVTIREYVDRGGQPVRTTMQLGPGMEIEMIEAERHVAKAEVDPPELLAAMFIEPDSPITAPRRLRSAAYELRLADEADPASFTPPRTGYQRVAWGDERTARVVTDLDQPVTAGDDLPGDAHRAASMLVDHEDPQVLALVAEALGDDADALDDAEKAERLRAFVHEHVAEKDLSVGFGTASEAARTGQGDCTEHAVLLAAMLRAVDIPSRVVSGLLYVDAFLGHETVFGGHMWTQAWLPATEAGGRTWLDLDATLPDAPIDAARITLSTSALDDGAGNDLVALLPLFGALEIEVLHTTLD